MSIHNNSLGPSVQRLSFTFQNYNGSVTSGETGVLAYIPLPGHLEAINLAAMSLASSPFLLLTLSRFIVGQGMTTFALGTTFAPPAFGTSGVFQGRGVTLTASFPSGFSAVPLMANDIIGYQVGGAGNTCMINGLVGSVILRPTQDVRTYFNAF